MLADLGVDGASVYEEDFEKCFLEDTRSFYRNESLSFLSQNSCPDYLERVELRLAEEMARVSNYLHVSTRSKLQLILEAELISAHASTLIERQDSGFYILLTHSEHRMRDLARMHNLFSQVPATLGLLRDALYMHVRTVGQSLVNDESKAEQPVEFLHCLLNLKKKYDGVVSDAFNGETIAQKRLKEAFESFINADTRCVSCLVIYVDELMKAGFKGAKEGEVEEELGNVLAIFRYLQDKDIFEALYKQHLAKRLLNRRSASFEAERQMLAKLKGECGYRYTTKLEGMFTDIKFSKDATMKYCSSSLGENHNNKPTIACDLDVTMLTAGYWPMQSLVPCILPSCAVVATELFKDFYLKEHSGRKLTWVTSCGSAELKVSISETARYELAVSTYQMCILALFNNRRIDDVLLFQDIARTTRIPESELKRHLISLCTPKHRILKKSAKGKSVAKTDTFQINTAFSPRLKRIRVPLVAMKEVSSHPHHHVPIAVEEDRRHLCEATVVRIMKARKHSSHNDLIAEVTRQLHQRFFPQPHFIKKSIESLIEREYLERCDHDARMYTYLA